MRAIGFLWIGVLAAMIFLSGCAKSVRITSSPYQAEVRDEDGSAYFGNTPLTVKVGDYPRTYRVGKTGYVAKNIVVSDVSPESLHVHLEPEASGKLLVEVIEGEKGQEVRRSLVHAEEEVIERSPNVRSVRRLTDFSGSRFVGSFSLSPKADQLVMEILNEEVMSSETPKDSVKKRQLSNLWCIPTTGGAQVRLTQGYYFDKDPTYSPDGRYVIFSSNRTGERSHIWRVARHTAGGLTMLTESNTADSHPQVSPGGLTLLYTAHMAGSPIPQIWSKPLPQGLPMQLREGHSAQWSPDGTSIVYCATDRTSAATKIWIMPADGTSSPTQLTFSSNANDKDPRWSPDGSQIIFASDRGQSQGKRNFDIWIMAADGSSPRQLTTNGSVDDKPVIAEDGRTIYFRSNRGLKWDIWIMEMASEPESIEESAATPDKGISF